MMNPDALFELCTLCDKPTTVRVGEVSLPVRHAACHAAFLKTRAPNGQRLFLPTDPPLIVSPIRTIMRHSIIADCARADMERYVALMAPEDSSKS